MAFLLDGSIPKSIAEKRLMENNFAEAKRFASQAKSRQPDLQGIDQLIVTIDMHIAEQRKTNWREIFSVKESVDLTTLKKRYRTMSLLLHPDKNKSVGANDAFRIVKDAYETGLAELLKKNNDQIRSPSEASQQNTSKATTSNPATRSEDVNFAANASSSKPIPKQQTTGAAGNVSSDPTPSSNSGVQKPKSSSCTPNSKGKGNKQKSGGSNNPPKFRHLLHRTFWTSCNNCNGKFEYPRVYRNHKIKCHMCHELFSATEIPAPSMT
ncbi:hypothetical protein ACP4OV_017533 [Aristida adscensionis]